MDANWLSVLNVVGTCGLVLLTFFLWRATAELASIGRKRPELIANIEPNPWSILDVDLVVVNFGSAPAYDISVNSYPYLSTHGKEPLHTEIIGLSLLRPSQTFKTSLDRRDNLFQKYRLVLEWYHSPSRLRRNRVSYIIDLEKYKLSGQLNNGDPSVFMALQLKSINEALRALPKSR